VHNDAIGTFEPWPKNAKRHGRIEQNEIDVELGREAIDASG
jgi:hypothetical protein